MRTPLWARKINERTVYRNFYKLKNPPAKRKPDELLDTLDKMEKGEYLRVDRKTCRLIRAMVERRKYTVKQRKLMKGIWRVEKR